MLPALLPQLSSMPAIRTERTKTEFTPASVLHAATRSKSRLVPRASPPEFPQYLSSNKELDQAMEEPDRAAANAQVCVAKAATGVFLFFCGLGRISSLPADAARAKYNQMGRCDRSFPGF